MSEVDQCATQEDLLTVMLGEVREMRTAFEEHFDLLEKYVAGAVVKPIKQLQYDLTETNTNVQFLVDAYRNQQQRQTLIEEGPRTPLAVVSGSKKPKGGNDV